MKLQNGLLVITQALRDAEVSIELRIIPEGGHGYGMNITQGKLGHH